MAEEPELPPEPETGALAIPAIPDLAPTDYQGAESPNWSANTKIMVTIGAAILVVALTLRFSNIIRMVTIAAIIAYLMNPIIALIHQRTPIKRGVAVALVYVLFVVVLVTAVTILGTATYIQATSFVQLLPKLVSDITIFIETTATQTEPVIIGAFSISPADVEWSAIGNQVLRLVEPAAGKSYQILTSVATRTVGIVGDFFFIFVLSIYLAAEIPKLGGYVTRVAREPGYQHDALRLMKSFSQVWSSYLRGQMILGLSVGFASWLGLAALGVQNAIALGIISGLLEFVPNIGPIIGAVIAVTVAFFQPANYLGLTSVQLALLTLGWMLIVQQLENNLLVPRIMGSALNLHPLLVILGLLMGASLAGILGAVLAAPILASVKLLGLYVWRKMFDLRPFAEPVSDSAAPPPRPSLRARLQQWLAQRRRAQRQTDK